MISDALLELAGVPKLRGHWGVYVAGDRLWGWGEWDRDEPPPVDDDEHFIDWVARYGSIHLPHVQQGYGPCAACHGPHGGPREQPTVRRSPW